MKSKYFEKRKRKMRLLLWLVLGGIILGACSSNRAQSQLIKKEEYPTIELVYNWDIAIFLDVYDPISYNIYIDNAKNICRIFFVTHKFSSGELNIKEYIQPLSKMVKTDLLVNIKQCDSYGGYVCQGLDGSEIWILQKTTNNDINIFQFWNPESQQTSRIGSDLVSLKNELINTYNIESLRYEFLKSLRHGKYWNYGEAILHH